MSIVKRTEDGKIKFDWGAVATMIICALLGGLLATPGVYYGIQYDIKQGKKQQEDTEKKVEHLQTVVNSILIKDAADTANFNNACSTLNEIKRKVDEIRDNQVRLQKKER